MGEVTELQRRLELHRLLKDKKKVVASDLARQWGCSERTVRRQLYDMRDKEQLPIEHDRIKKTWWYTREVVELPAMLATGEDRRALLFSLRAAAQFEDVPVADQVERVYQHLLATLSPERVTKYQQLMKSVCFTGPRMPKVSRRVWDMLLNSIEDRETLHITYTDGGYGSTTHRDIDPYGLIMRDRRWVLVAYCHWVKEVRTFSVSRIGQADYTEKYFDMPEDFMDRYLADSFDGWQSTGDKAKVVLRIDKDAPPYVRDRLWSENEARWQDKQGNLLIEFQTAALFAVEREVCAEEGWVELLEPANRRKCLREIGLKMAKIHQ